MNVEVSESLHVFQAEAANLKFLETRLKES